MKRVQNKLFNYSEKPPANAWNPILAALDEKPGYAQKLYQFEQQPPEAAWENVARQLSAPQPKVVLLRTKLFKYAIAAAVLTALAAGSIFYFKQDASTRLASQSPNSVSNPSGNDNASDSPFQTGTERRDNTVQNNAGTETNAEYADGHKPTEDAFVHFSPSVRIVQDAPAARDISVTLEAKNFINTELSNRYMIATTADGDAVRLPKKAYSDYACADMYNNTYCKEKIASIQSKMAASVATDFTDFMDLLKKIQDN